MPDYLATTIAAFCGLTVLLSTAFFKLATELARLRGAVDTLVSCVRLLRETADENSRRIGTLRARIDAMEIDSRREPDDPET